MAKLALYGTPLVAEALSTLVGGSTSNSEMRMRLWSLQTTRCLHYNKFVVFRVSKMYLTHKTERNVTIRVKLDIKMTITGPQITVIPMRGIVSGLTDGGYVDRIKWAESNRTKALAEGVEYTAPDGSVKTLYANEEIIFSAGSVRSSAILELSGVGNPEILEDFKIPVKIFLPSVGENVIDQPNTFIAYASNSTFSGMAPYVTYMTASDILRTEAGTVAAEIAAQLKTWADQVAEASDNALSTSALEHLSNPARSYLCPRRALRRDLNYSARNKPINPNYLMAQWDLILQRKIAQTVARFWKTAPVSSVAGESVQPPGTDLPIDTTEDEWDAWISRSSQTTTFSVRRQCSLRELGGVVDNNLIVYGTENVRGHLASTLCAIAERAAGIIKNKLGKQ
ncbi:hypothetical protein AN7408.2 [Aspergillus nidulans FGSC A4]|uniref:Glucose-methanol-choline oxidoreductase N-terminal domain-containing protein n=1 Tax=Emericella nidulans (strain FGSC A4 / ATCC 38163 / CBS 112.46 / NRRL 194 / M139) TaxID=227321 RepID=Q5AWC2_EMENI|nr:hypothetical protein [Aspergillus nidulans FGSC A4]EAA61779.1 hypothetical protein AN7408.2 [Aspergillus nidulans FGSC A4]CBF78439.1 TPA: conserved hypothetical protein [Aspergillus nidulans FGSC A4]|eukprot:XP_680677.1 hypothetical protein AN7408.2 [Aspergillus nidulans FGSC A4]